MGISIAALADKFGVPYGDVEVLVDQLIGIDGHDATVEKVAPITSTSNRVIGYDVIVTEAAAETIRGQLLSPARKVAADEVRAWSRRIHDPGDRQDWAFKCAQLLESHGPEARLPPFPSRFHSTRESRDETVRRIFRERLDVEIMRRRDART